MAMGGSIVIGYCQPARMNQTNRNCNELLMDISILAIDLNHVRVNCKNVAINLDQCLTK
jgi:hypothetical protein